MNEFDSTFSSVPDLDEVMQSGDTRQSLVSHMEKYNGCSDCATKCLKQMERLAELFNHSTLGVSHLIAAMTLVPCAFRAFQLRNIDVTTAFRTAMLSLIEMERVKPGDAVAEASSSELNHILILAGNIAKERDYQEVSVHDLLTALNSLPPDAPAADAIRGGSKQAQVQNLRAELEVFARSLTQNVTQQVQELMPPQQPPIDFQTRSDIADIKRDLQFLNSQISDIRSRAMADPTPEAVANSNVNPLPKADQPGWLQNVFGTTAR